MADKKIALWMPEALRTAEISQAELARKLSDRLGRKIDRSMVQKVLKGVRRLTGEELIAVAEITGSSPPTDPPSSATPQRASDPSSKSSSGSARREIGPDATPEFDLRSDASAGGGYRLPAAVGRDGVRRYDGDCVRAEWRFPKRWLEDEMRLAAATTDVLAVAGSSMAPDLIDGDRVLIDRMHRDPRQGGIFAIREGDGVLINHVELLHDAGDSPRIRCSSSNIAYQPFELVLDGDRVAIIGRVAGRITRL
jgi:phage repressor protein C with HTH and peptisase S24 domain